MLVLILFSIVNSCNHSLCLPWVNLPSSFQDHLSKGQHCVLFVCCGFIFESLNIAEILVVSHFSELDNQESYFLVLSSYILHNSSPWLIFVFFLEVAKKQFMLCENSEIILARFWVDKTAWRFYLLWEKMLLQLVPPLFCFMVVISLAQNISTNSLFSSRFCIYLFEKQIKQKLNPHATGWPHIFWPIKFVALWFFFSIPFIYLF